MGKNGFEEPLVKTDLRCMVYISLHANISCPLLGQIYQSEAVSLSDHLLC
jgi:hypothetical protein